MANRQRGDVNYEPSITSRTSDDPRYVYSRLPLSGTSQTAPIAKTNDFAQAGIHYGRLSSDARERLVDNLAADLGQVRDRQVKARIVGFMMRADPDYGAALARAIGISAQEVKAALASIASL